MALTDHDTVGGIVEAVRTASEYPQLTFIPGTELSADVPEGEVHMLGYFIDYTSTELLRELEIMRTSRIERAWGMVE